MFKVLVTTVPFGEYSDEPIRLLKSANVDYEINPLGRKLTEDEMTRMIAPYHGVIAGTESISAKVLANAKNLKAISRVGVGLDSVDLLQARKQGVRVSYTPEAPAPAVAELTIGAILGTLRHIPEANRLMHEGQWKRFFGARIGGAEIGLVGCGRIGTMVANLLKPFGPKKIRYCDPVKSADSSLEQVSLEEVLAKSDIVSLHLPLKKDTVNLIAKGHLAKMKKSAIIVNTSRGGIINEADLFDALKNKTIAGAAIDVFEQEPYNGPLNSLNNCLLTCHMGSMSNDCRTRMEIESTKDMIQFIQTGRFEQEVPEAEYELRK